MHVSGGYFLTIPERVTSPTEGANFHVNRPLASSKGFDSGMRCEVREQKKWGVKEGEGGKKKYPPPQPHPLAVFLAHISALCPERLVQATCFFTVCLVFFWHSLVLIFCIINKSTVLYQNLEGILMKRYRTQYANDDF